MIQDGGEELLLQTGMVNHGRFGLPVRFLTAWLLVLPLGGVIGWTAIRSERARVLAGAAGTGGVASLAVAAPYIEMHGLLQAQTTGFLLLGGVWPGSLAMAGYWLLQRL